MIKKTRERGGHSPRWAAEPEKIINKYLMFAFAHHILRRHYKWLPSARRHLSCTFVVRRSRAFEIEHITCRLFVFSSSLLGGLLLCTRTLVFNKPTIANLNRVTSDKRGGHNPTTEKLSKKRRELFAVSAVGLSWWNGILRHVYHIWTNDQRCCQNICTMNGRSKPFTRRDSESLPFNCLTEYVYL
jgi:hypothetical protein